MHLINNTIELIQKNYEKSDIPWVLGYSGGKDSTALLILVYNAIKKSNAKNRKVFIVYCDTGVEIPIVRDYAHKTLSDLDIEAKKDGLPIFTKIKFPNLEDSFFCKVIGRGYPTPTNKFRWCTDRLRVKPLQSVFNSTNQKNIVLLGVRNGESTERDRIIQKHSTEDEYYYKQANYNNAIVFSPIINFKVADVWKTIDCLPEPTSIDRISLKNMYKIVSDLEIESKKNSDFKIKGRFGCWTCTVIRKDKAMKQLVDYGYKNLKPLYDFRNWMMSIRDNPDYRCSVRRNGQLGKGPFTLDARKEIFNRLLEVQNESGMKLITDSEINIIYELWDKDIKSDKYIEHRL